MGFGGADIPGYAGVPSQNLFVAFYQLGVFYPFFRAHCEINNTRREPWLQNPTTQEVIRESVFLRYSLIHYIYTTFATFADTGVPLMRPMWLEYPTGDWNKVYAQFMFGDSILFAPKLNDMFNGVFSVDVKLPEEDIWYDHNTGLVMDQNVFRMDMNATELGLFYKGGSILPMLAHKRELSLMNAINNSMSLEVRLDAASKASGKVTLDDGVTTKDTRSDVKFIFDGFTLSYEVIRTPTVAVELKSSHVSTVIFYGVTQSPV